MSEMQFVIATDGGTYQSNPGPGTYGYIIRGYLDGKLLFEKTEAHAVEGQTTNNRMEMAAILFSIYAVHDTIETIEEVSSDVVEIISDSNNAISSQMQRYKSSGLRLPVTRTFMPV
jgi:ribonuclease HI